MNLFPAERETGAWARTLAFDDHLVVDLAVVNGQLLGRGQLRIAGLDVRQHGELRRRHAHDRRVRAAGEVEQEAPLAGWLVAGRHAVLVEDRLDVDLEAEERHVAGGEGRGRGPDGGHRRGGGVRGRLVRGGRLAASGIVTGRIVTGGVVGIADGRASHAGAQEQQQGGGVALVRVENRLVFDVNLGAITRSGLRVSPQMLRLARDVVGVPR